MRNIKILLSIILLLTLTACQNINVEKPHSIDNNLKQKDSIEEHTATTSPTVEVTPTAQPTPTLSPTATPTVTPAPTPIPRTITLEKIGDNNSQFDFKPYKYWSKNQVTIQNDYTFSIHQNTIIAYSMETDESFLFKELDNERYNGIVDVMSIEKIDSKKFNIYYTSEISYDAVNPKYEDLYQEYFSNYQMSALFSSLSEKPIINFLFNIIKVEDNRIIYLADDMKLYAFDMRTEKITALNKNVSDLLNNDRYGIPRNNIVHTVKKLPDFYFTYNDNGDSIMRIYSKDNHENEICGYKLPIDPIDNILEDVITIGDLIYLVYGEVNDVVSIDVLDTTNNTLHKLYSESCEYFKCMLLDDKLVAMYHDFEENIKIITYDEGDDDCKIVYTGECQCKSRPDPEYGDYKFDRINYMFYKGNRIFGYSLEEARIGIQYFVTDIIDMD